MILLCQKWESDKLKSISKQLEQYQIDKAYTSPLGRAVQTSNIILSKKEVEPIYEERFKEVNFGILEGISTELVRKLNIESPTGRRFGYGLQTL